jgi:hypothetical protein
MDELIRYIPAMKRVGAYASVLEIGSGLTGICSYVNRRIDAIDPLLGAGVSHPRLAPVGTDFFDNGLADGSYDLVLAIDFLEHVPRDQRERALREMLRIARRALLIGFPCGEGARRVDGRWHSEFARRGETPPDWLDEHVRFGIPEREEVLSVLDAAGVRYSTFWNAGIGFHTFFARMAHTPGLRRAKRLAEQVARHAYPLVEAIGSVERERYRFFVLVEK